MKKVMQVCSYLGNCAINRESVAKAKKMYQESGPVAEKECLKLSK